MRVIEVRRFGGPEVLVPVDADDPIPGPGEIVVDVAAADVLFLDTVIRRGAGGPHFPLRPPYVPGTGVAGVTADGRRVLVETNGGGYASKVLATSVIDVPPRVGLRDAAALLHDGRTAYGLLESTPVRAGDRVLVTAAGGGLGLLLVQLAVAAGARVVAAARGSAKLAAAAGAGASATVDYTAADWAEAVLAALDGAGPDVVFDGAGGDFGKAAFGIVAPGGRFSAHGAPGGFVQPDPAAAAARGVTIHGIERAQFGPDEIRRLTGLALAHADRIRPVIGATFPLDQAADAHAALERRAVVGKTLLIP